MTSSQDTPKALLSLLNSREEGEAWHPMALLAKGKDPKFNPTWEQAMNGPLAEGYKDTDCAQVQSLGAIEVYEEVDKEPWMNVLPGTWAFKKKGSPLDWYKN